jgi:superfamily II DNA or RNA helicase
MADLRSRNNASSKKSYEKELEREHAMEYELEVVRRHALLPSTEVFHWPRVPEDWLYDCGYITDYNKHRHERLMRKKEMEAGKNRVRDYGFDGLARTRIDSVYVYSGIQAKYYLSKQVCASDIGSFLASQISLMLKNPLSKGYLYTTSTLQADLSGNITNPSYPIRHILHPWKHNDGRSAPKIVPIIKECDLPLRPYQLDALKQLEGKDGINALSIPCRMGKTVIAGHNARRSNAKLVIAIAPLMVSVDNLQERLACFFPSYSSLLVDSDTGGTTDIGTIQEFLKSEGHHVIYSTFKSAIDILSSILTDYNNSYILADEIHNANEELCDFIQQFPRGLVLSATLPEEVMDMLEINHIVHIPFSQAIRDGYIVDYTLWLPHLTKKTNGTTCVDIDIPVEFAKYDSDLTAKAFYLATVMLKTGSRRCITYLSNQGQCDSFMPLVSHIFKTYHGLTVWTDKIDSTVSKVARKKIIEEFQSENDDVFHILTSVRILDEAVDIPRCDSVFITSFGPENDIRMTQRSQRSSTKDPLNPSKHSNIILWADGLEKCVGALDRLRESDPDFHKKVRMADCNYDRSGEVARIESVKEEAIEFEKWEGMKCLTTIEHHLKIIEEIKLFYTNYGEEPYRNGKRETESQLSNYLHNCRHRYSINKLNSDVIKLFEEHLSWFSWNKLEDHHSRMILEIKDYYDKYKKHPDIKYKDGLLLRYINSRRYDARKNKLPTELKTKIDKAWPWFIWNPKTENHTKKINELKQFYEKYGSEPKSGSMRDNGNEKILWHYILGQRAAKRKSLIEKDLEELIIKELPWFRWNVFDTQHTKSIEQLKLFYETYHDEPKKNGTRADGNEKNLCNYIGDRRKNKKAGTLDPKLEAKIMLELPWFKWEILEGQHTSTIQAIKVFYEKYGEEPNKRGTRDDGNESKLGMYISQRRVNKKKGKLREGLEDYINEQIPWFNWGILESRHETNIDNLVNFYKKYKELPKTKGERENEKILYAFISNRRIAKRKGNLETSLEKTINEKCPWFPW